MLGLAGGWKQDRDFQTVDEGTATYVYAAFDPEITGKWLSALYKHTCI